MEGNFGKFVGNVANNITHTVSVSVVVFIAISNAVYAVFMAISNAAYAINFPPFSLSSFQRLGHSLSQCEAARSNPHPTFMYCMQNDVTTVEILLSLRKKSPCSLLHDNSKTWH